TGHIETTNAASSASGPFEPATASGSVLTASTPNLATGLQTQAALTAAVDPPAATEMPSEILLRDLGNCPTTLNASSAAAEGVQTLAALSAAVDLPAATEMPSEILLGDRGICPATLNASSAAAEGLQTQAALTAAVDPPAVTEMLSETPLRDIGNCPTTLNVSRAAAEGVQTLAALSAAVDPPAVTEMLSETPLQDLGNCPTTLNASNAAAEGVQTLAALTSAVDLPAATEMPSATSMGDCSACPATLDAPGNGEPVPAASASNVADSLLGENPAAAPGPPQKKTRKRSADFAPTKARAIKKRNQQEGTVAASNNGQVAGPSGNISDAANITYAVAPSVALESSLETALGDRTNDLTGSKLVRAAPAPNVAEGETPAIAPGPPLKKLRNHGADCIPAKPCPTKGKQQEGTENALTDCWTACSSGTHPITASLDKIHDALVMSHEQTSAKQDAILSALNRLIANVDTAELKATVASGFERMLEATEGVNESINRSHDSFMDSLQATSGVPAVDEPEWRKVKAQHVIDALTAAVSEGRLIRQRSHTMVTGDFAGYFKNYMQTRDYVWPTKSGPKKALDHILQEIDRTG
ncbi:hypothetical protein HDU87_003158, partial [Geranomyces variabilis]